MFLSKLSKITVDFSVQQGSSELEKTHFEKNYSLLLNKSMRERERERGGKGEGARERERERICPLF